MRCLQRRLAQLAGCVLAVPLIVLDHAGPADAAGCEAVGYESTAGIDPHAIGVDTGGDVWLASSFPSASTGPRLGIYHLDPQNGDLEAVFETEEGVSAAQTEILVAGGGVWFNTYVEVDDGFGGSIDVRTLARLDIATNDIETFDAVQGKAMALGADGRVWGAFEGGGGATSIWAIDASTSDITFYPIPEREEGGWNDIHDSVLGPDGNLWVTSFAGDAIGRITTDGDVTWFGHSTLNGPRWLDVAPDGTIWFTQIGNVGDSTRTFGRISTAGAISTFRVGNPPAVSGLEYQADGGVVATATGIWSVEARPGTGSAGRELVYRFSDQEPTADLTASCFTPSTFGFGTAQSHPNQLMAAGPLGMFVTGENGSGDSSVYRIDSSAPPPPPAPTCAGLPVTVDLGEGEVPTAGADVILGTAGPDVINGLGGADTICALGGNDTVNGGPGNDRIFGGAGVDRLRGDGGADTVRGGAGNDVIDGGGGPDTLSGDGGADVVRGQTGHDRLFGNAGNDSFNGGSGRDRCDGGAGRDRAVGCEVRVSIP